MFSCVAIATHTGCVRGYSHVHNTLILVYISVRVAIPTRTCAWLSHAHVYKYAPRIVVNRPPRKLKFGTGTLFDQTRSTSLLASLPVAIH